MLVSAPVWLPGSYCPASAPPYRPARPRSISGKEVMKAISNDLKYITLKPEILHCNITFHS